MRNDCRIGQLYNQFKDVSKTSQVYPNSTVSDRKFSR